MPREFINQAVDERFDHSCSLSHCEHSFPFQVSTKVPLESVRVDIQDLSSTTLSRLLTMNPPFEILLDFGELHHQTVVQYRAVVSHKHELIHSGEYVQLHTPINEVQQFDDHLNAEYSQMHLSYTCTSVVQVWSAPYYAHANIEWCICVFSARV